MIKTKRTIYKAYAIQFFYCVAMTGFFFLFLYQLGAYPMNHRIIHIKSILKQEGEEMSRSNRVKLEIELQQLKQGETNE